MDFDDHEEEEEMGDLPGGGGSSYDTPPPPPPSLGNSARSGPKSNTTAGTNESTPAGMLGSGHRKSGCGGQRYRECLKNHAVNIGGHAVDGCGEFMAAGEEGTLDALKCAACNCHRNFHRKEVEGGGGLGLMGDAAGSASFQHQKQFSPYYRTPAGYLHHHHVAMHQRMAPPPLALPSTSGGGGSRDEEQDLSDPMVGGGGGAGGGTGGGSSSGPSKKRFRTKFTQEQKDKMLEFAERVGWRMQKHDEAAVQQFCAETGVQRHVLKVWMHNNKHTLGKAPPTQAGTLMQHSALHQHQHQQEREVEMGERNNVTPGA